MKDRSVQYPKRYRLTKTPGTDDIYDLDPAPGEITEEGTLINKGTLLSDDTAAKFFESLVGTETVNQVLGLLGRLYTRIGDEWVWAKKQYVDVISYGETKSFQGVFSTPQNSVTYAENIEIINGSVEMVNPSTNSSFTNYLSYIYKSYPYFKIANAREPLEAETIYMIYGETYNNGSSWSGSALPMQIASVLQTVCYVNSPNPTAYPPAEPDGYTYIPLGQLGDKVQIAKGEYTGTGTYGNDNPVTLTFPFEPSLVLVVSTGPSVTYAFFVRNCNGYLIGSNSGEIGTRWDRNSIIWFSKVGQGQNMNISGYIYQYIALG